MLPMKQFSYIIKDEIGLHALKSEPYSCKQYPKRYGIPPEIWNGKNKKCPYFEKKQIER